MQEPGAEAILAPCAALAQHRQHAQIPACAQMWRVSSRTAPFSPARRARPWRRRHGGAPTCGARQALGQFESVKHLAAPRTRDSHSNDGRAHAGCPGFCGASTLRAHARNAGRCPRQRAQCCANSAGSATRAAAVGFGQMHHGIWAARSAAQSEATAAVQTVGPLEAGLDVSAAPSMSCAPRRRERRKYAAQANTMKAWEIRSVQRTRLRVQRQPPRASWKWRTGTRTGGRCGRVGPDASTHVELARARHRAITFGGQRIPGSGIQ